MLRQEIVRPVDQAGGLPDDQPSLREQEEPVHLRRRRLRFAEIPPVFPLRQRGQGRRLGRINAAVVGGWAQVHRRGGFRSDDRRR